MESGRAAENAAVFALLRESGLKWSALRDYLERFSRPTDALRSLLAADLIEDDYRLALERASQQIEAFGAEGIEVNTFVSESYPQQLLTVHDFPPVIYTKGHFAQKDDASVAVVGTREPTEGALIFVRQLVQRLASAGLPVVSGLARGIDVAAMRESLRLNNRTVGVIGTGVNRYYPKEHVEIQDEVARNHLLISQFWPDAGADKRSFPMRNRVMSAFSSVTVIAEASENSGTRIQARAATQHGRPLIISRAVYLQTQWAKELVEQRLDVTIVADADEAMAAIRRAQSRPEFARDLSGTLLAG